MVELSKDIEKVLFSEEKIQEIIARIGKQITEDYKGKKLIMVSVLKGSVVFMADLMRAIDLPLSIDFMVVSSYGAGTKSTGNVRILKDLGTDIAGYDVLIVEDILDSGITLSTLKEMLEGRKPNSIKICTFFDKPERRISNIKADYIGDVVPDEFIVGYGLDYDEKYRNLPFVGVLKREIYED